MLIEKKYLSEIDKQAVIDLLNNPQVREHMPLATEIIGETGYADFIAAKNKMWLEQGYGPWAFLVEGEFVGWGGLQPENGDVEIAIVLNPKFWGIGRAIYLQIIQYAFDVLKLESVIILLPPSRKSVRGILRAGFEKDGETYLNGNLFNRYRLFNKKKI